MENINRNSEPKEEKITNDMIAKQLELEYPQYEGFKGILPSDLYDDFRNIDDEINIEWR